MLEIALLIGVLRYDAFYRQLKALDVCPVATTGLLGHVRPDFNNQDINRVFGLVARHRDGLGTPSVPGDQSIGVETLNSLFAEEVKAGRIPAERAREIAHIPELGNEGEGWLVRDLKTLDLDRAFIFGLPSTPVFREWRMQAAIRAELKEFQMKSNTATGHLKLDDFEHAYRRVKQACGSMEEEFVVDTMGEIEADDGKPPEALVEGVLPVGGLALMSGRAKSHKSWSALDLNISGAAGNCWNGFRVTKCRSVYVNLELKQKTLRSRIKRIAFEKGIEPKALEGWLIPITVKTGTALSAALKAPSKFGFLATLLEGLAARIERIFNESSEVNPDPAKSPRLIVLDSLYNLHGGRLNENDPGEMSILYQMIRDLAERLGATVMIVHHFTKGAPDQKLSGDRAAGTRVHKQAVDTYIELVPHQLERCYVFDAQVRDYPEIAKFCLRWQAPLLVPAPELDTDAVQRTGKRKEQESIDSFVELLEHPLSIREWKEKTMRILKISESTFWRYKRKAENEEKVTCDREGNWIKSNCQLPSDSKRPENGANR
jgi:hypothetical protein